MATANQTNSVALAIEEMMIRLNTISFIKDKTIQIYSNDDLSTAKKQLTAPCVGIAYMGLEGLADSSKTGIKATLRIDCYFIGGDTCNVMVNGSLIEATEILCDMRTAMLGECVEAPGTKAKWNFRYERPVTVGKMMGFVQRWETSSATHRTKS